MKAFGVRLSENDLETIFRGADKDGGGTIDAQEFKLLIKSINRNSQYKLLQPDQWHLIFQVSSESHRDEFVQIVSTLEQTYPGLVRLSTLEANSESKSQEEGKQVALSYSPDSTQHLFSIEKRDKGFYVRDCQDDLDKILGGEITPRALEGRDLLEILHPHIAHEVSSLTGNLMVHGQSGLRLVQETRMQLKPGIGGKLEAEGTEGISHQLVASGMLAKRKGSAGLAAGPPTWITTQCKLTDTGYLLSFNSEILLWESTSLQDSVPGPLGEKTQFEIHADGGTTVFAAATAEEQAQWCAALQLVCRRNLVPVQLVVAEANLIRVECGLVCSIKQHLVRDGISFMDRTEAPIRQRENTVEHPARALEYKRLNCPKALICVINPPYFDDPDCLSDFEAYSSGLYGKVSFLPVLSKNFEFPLRDQVCPWWSSKRRWQKWEASPLFVDARREGKEQHLIIADLLVPTLHAMLDAWRAPTRNEAPPQPDDEITCTGCSRIGLKHPQKFRRRDVETYHKMFLQEEMLRRVEGKTKLEPLYPCEYCGGESKASQLLDTGITSQCIPCPSCISNGYYPPMTFERNECRRRLRNNGHMDVLRCSKEAMDVRVLDILVPNCFLSHADGEDADGADKLAQALMREDGHVLVWPTEAAATTQAARHAIRRSSAVVLLLSDNYFASARCIQEFSSAVQEEKLVIPLVLEPSSFFSEESVLQEADGWLQWYPDDSPDQCTCWSILKHFTPVDFRTHDARTRNVDQVLRLLSTGMEETAGKYAHWKTGLEPVLLAALNRLEHEDVGEHIRSVFATLDTDGSGSLDPCELATAMGMFGLMPDVHTQISCLMEEVTVPLSAPLALPAQPSRAMRGSTYLRHARSCCKRAEEEEVT